MARTLVTFGALLVMLGSACERSPSPTAAPSAKPGATAPADGSAAADDVAAEVRAAMKEFLAHGESVLAIMREHGADCELAASKLGERVEAFEKLAPRMMALKDKMQTLPAAEREQLQRETNELMTAMQRRYPDADELEQRAKQCGETSPAFAAIAPRVMFTKKKN